MTALLINTPNLTIELCERFAHVTVGNETRKFAIEHYMDKFVKVINYPQFEAFVNSRTQTTDEKQYSEECAAISAITPLADLLFNLA